MKDNPSRPNLALGKKRRDNRLVETMLTLKGELDAAINADNCQESMLKLAREMGQAIPDHLYYAAIESADELQPFLEECAAGLRAFRSRTDQHRRLLENASE